MLHDRSAHASTWPALAKCSIAAAYQTDLFASMGL